MKNNIWFVAEIDSLTGKTLRVAMIHAESASKAYEYSVRNITIRGRCLFENINNLVIAKGSYEDWDKVKVL